MQPEFGRRLREQRIERGLSQGELAGQTLSTSYISLLEAGKRQATPKIAQQLAERLAVDVEYLLTGLAHPRLVERELEVRFAELALLSGDPAQARVTFERLRDDGVCTDDQWRVDYGLARACEAGGDLEMAIELLEILRERAEQDPARWPWLVVTMDLSRCYREAGDLTRAVGVAERTVERARSLGLDGQIDFPRLVVTWAGASRERGDLAHASQLLRRLLLQMDEGTPRRDRGAALWNAALVASEQGHFTDGILLAERAIAQFTEEDEIRAQASLRTLLAWIHLEAPDGDVDAARALLGQAHQTLSEAGMQVELAYTETELARAEVALGNPDAAMAWARSSLERLGDANRLESVRARLALARALLSRGEDRPAVEEMRAAAAALSDATAGRQAAAVWRDLAELEAAAGHHENSQASFRMALDLLGVPGHQLERLAVRTSAETRSRGS